MSLCVQEHFTDRCTKNFSLTGESMWFHHKDSFFLSQVVVPRPFSPHLQFFFLFAKTCFSVHITHFSIKETETERERNSRGNGEKEKERERRCQRDRVSERERERERERKKERKRDRKSVGAEERRERERSYLPNPSARAGYDTRSIFLSGV